MSSIIKGAGDAVSSTIDAVTDNKEIIAAITAAYFLGPPAIATETTAALTAEEIAAAELAEATTVQAAEAKTINDAYLAKAQNDALATTSKLAASGSGNFLNALNATGEYSTLTQPALDNIAANNAANNAYNLSKGSLYNQTLFGTPEFINKEALNEGAGATGTGTKGWLGESGKFNFAKGQAADFGRSLIPQTPMEYVKAGLTTTSGLNLYNAYKGTQQGTSDFERRMSANRNRTNDYSGPQAPSTYNSQSQIPLATRYNAARQQVSQTVGTPSSVGLLAVNNSPFYDFLNTNNINRGIL